LKNFVKLLNDSDWKRMVNGEEEARNLPNLMEPRPDLTVVYIQLMNNPDFSDEKRKVSKKLAS
jgi:hypothetical protein